MELLDLSRELTDSDPPSRQAGQRIRFVLDGKLHCVGDLSPTTTVLDYLRNDARRTGTKEGCAEGDCGACTVVLGELSPDGSRVTYRAINSCIRFLPTLDGKELVTVESLQARDGTLHPVQRAMVEEHASQCGFCTPGFVMSLFALYLESAAEPTREAVVDALAGNLCRCTGYRPIIDAGCRMRQLPEPAHWGRTDAHSEARLERLRELRRCDPEEALQLPGYRAPRNLNELDAALASDPQSLILAGGTDVGLWVTKHLRELPNVVYLGDVAELHEVRGSDDGLWVGAAVPLSRAWPVLVEAHPALAEQARRFASPPVCNSGTLCGNIANGSPIGDSMPSLIALGAQIDLRRQGQQRRLPLERFYLGYQKKDLAPGEYVYGVYVPTAAAGTLFGSYKLAKRFDQDISAVCAAFAIEVTDGQVVGARLAFGGMAAVPARAVHAEAALVGRKWCRESIDAAMTALSRDFTPLTDMRASNEYRMRSAANLLLRFFLAS